jgi:hypothetical protein
MQRSLIDLPDGIEGLILQDVKLAHPKGSVMHLILTCFENQEGKIDLKMHDFYQSDFAKHLSLMHTGRFAGQLESYFGETPAQRMAELMGFVRRELEGYCQLPKEDGFLPVYNEQYVYAEQDKPHFMTPATRAYAASYEAPTLFGRSLKNLFARGTMTPVKVAWASNVDSGETGAFSPIPVIRLSKEEWLRQHYPEMKELPKWRFPSVAG